MWGADAQWASSSADRAGRRDQRPTVLKGAQLQKSQQTGAEGPASAAGYPLMGLFRQTGERLWALLFIFAEKIAEKNAKNPLTEGVSCAIINPVAKCAGVVQW